MVSFCVTTWMRFEMVIECFSQILDDDRISEVIISDDASTDGSYEKLCDYFRHEPKVKIYQNSINLDCFLNKRRAIELATNDFIIIADSDNIFSTDYLDRIFDYSWSEDVIFQPSFAMPNFDFQQYQGLIITKNNVAEYIDKPMFETMLNAFNFFVNKNSFLETWDKMEILEPMTSDSLWFNYNWLKDGKSIFVVPDLFYYHRVHEGSHYQNNISKTPIGFHQSVLQKIKELK